MTDPMSEIGPTPSEDDSSSSSSDSVSPDESSTPEEALLLEEPPDEPAASAKPKRRGRGFLFGLVLGVAVGAAATLLSPRKSAEPAATEAPPTENTDGALAKLRARLREAAGEARHAAREAEDAKRGRFTELIERE